MFITFDTALYYINCAVVSGVYAVVLVYSASAWIRKRKDYFWMLALSNFLGFVFSFGSLTFATKLSTEGYQIFTRCWYFGSIAEMLFFAGAIIKIFRALERGDSL